MHFEPPIFTVIRTIGGEARFFPVRISQVRPLTVLVASVDASGHASERSFELDGSFNDDGRTIQMRAVSAKEAAPHIGEVLRKKDLQALRKGSEDMRAV